MSKISLANIDDVPASNSISKNYESLSAILDFCEDRHEPQQNDQIHQPPHRYEIVSVDDLFSNDETTTPANNPLAKITGLKRTSSDSSAGSSIATDDEYHVSPASKRLHANSTLCYRSASKAVKSNVCYDDLTATLVVRKSMLYTPKFISESQKSSCHLVSRLSCENIILSMEKTFHQLQQQQQSPPEKFYFEYFPLDFTWNVMFLKSSTRQCQLRIQIFQSNDLNSSPVASPLPIVGNPSFYSNVTPYVLNFRYEDGEKTLYYEVFHQIKEKMNVYEEDLTRELNAISLTSRIPVRLTKAISLPELSSFSPRSSGLQSSYVFYQRNAHLIDQWVASLGKEDCAVSSQDKLDSLKHLASLVEAGVHEPLLLQMLERKRLVDSLLTVFQPATAETQTSSSVHVSCESEERCIMKAYVVQVLVHFLHGSVETMEKLSVCKELLEYCAEVVTAHRPSESADFPGSLVFVHKDCEVLLFALNHFKQTPHCQGAEEELNLREPVALCKSHSLKGQC